MDVNIWESGFSNKSLNKLVLRSNVVTVRTVVHQHVFIELQNLQRKEVGAG